MQSSSLVSQKSIYSLKARCNSNQKVVIGNFAGMDKKPLQHILEKLPYCETDDDRQKLLPKNYKDNLEREKNKSDS